MRARLLPLLRRGFVPRRRYAAAPDEIHMPPLSEPLKGLPPTRFTPDSVVSAHRFGPTTISKLDNGPTVVTEPKFGQCATIGVALHAGSRYEAAYPSGVTHLIEKLAYNSTLKYPDQAQLVDVAEKYGAIWDAQASRDIFFYAANCRIDGVNEVMSLLADACWRAQITDEEFEAAKQVVHFDADTIQNRPDVEMIMTDYVHAAAFRDNTLGLPKICPDSQAITREHVYAFMSKHFVPERMIVVGVGIDHETLEKSAKQLFVDERPIWKMEPSRLPKNVPEVDNSYAQYTGGEKRVERDLSHVGAGTPYPHLAHIMLGLQGVSYHEQDYIPLCVLNSLMGGGCHFSSGGPGKGMYTRLYTTVLNAYHWMYACTSYHHAYADNGLYCLQASAPPEQLYDALRAVTHSLTRLKLGFHADEIARAKAQLSSLLLMNLEMRPVQLEDTARVVMALGYRKSPMEFIDDINKVTEADLMRCVERMLASRPAFAAHGKLDAIAHVNYASIERAFAECDHTLLSKQRLFVMR